MGVARARDHIMTRNHVHYITHIFCKMEIKLNSNTVNVIYVPLAMPHAYSYSGSWRFLPQVVREHWPQVGMTCTLEPV